MAEPALICSICSLVLSLLYFVSACASSFVNSKTLVQPSRLACLVNACLLTALTVTVVVVLEEQELRKALFLIRTSIFIVNFGDVGDVFC
jgi:hypothetical protein